MTDTATQDVVPWSELDPKWQWYARDAVDEDCFLFAEIPIIEDDYWAAEDFSDFASLEAMPHEHKVGTCSWRDSLQQRPTPDEVTGE